MALAPTRKALKLISDLREVHYLKQNWKCDELKSDRPIAQLTIEQVWLYNLLCLARGCFGSALC